MEAANASQPTPVDKRLYETIAELAGGEFPKTSNKLTKVLGFKKDRIVNGLRLEKGPDDTHKKVGQWRVIKVESSPSDKNECNDIEQF
jgi:hypothetical protein